MRRDVVIAKPLAQMSGHAFSHPARVDEHQRRLVLTNKCGNSIVYLFPDFV